MIDTFWDLGTSTAFWVQVLRTDSGYKSLGLVPRMCPSYLLFHRFVAAQHNTELTHNIVSVLRLQI